LQSSLSISGSFRVSCLRTLLGCVTYLYQFETRTRSVKRSVVVAVVVPTTSSPATTRGG
jgi:hypothetical protein